MEEDSKPPPEPTELLQQLIGIFTDKGWLNQTVRIKHRGCRYRLLCSEKTFIAYRINSRSGLSPGVPGWPVCIIDRDQIVENSVMSPFPDDEPGVQSWLHCLLSGDFETG